MNNDLFSLKRALERAVSSVTHYVFANAELKAKHTVAGYFSGPCDDARYFYAQANNRKGFDKHVAAIVKAEKSLITDAKFQGLVFEARSSYATVEKAVADDKARLAAKRADLAARKSQKAELGVDLKKIEHATAATYKTLRAALEPVRISVEQHYLELLNERHAQLHKIVSQRGGVKLAFTVKVDGKRDRLELPEDFYFFFSAIFHDCPKDHDDLDGRIVDRAHARAMAETDAFAGKLAGKIDRDANGAALISAEVSGRSLWNNSTLLARLQYDVVQTWDTQVIWNRSCLGKSFNQWPTRRTDAAAKGGAS